MAGLAIMEVGQAPIQDMDELDRYMQGGRPEQLGRMYATTIEEEV